jgi:hypothetical protein
MRASLSLLHAIHLFCQSSCARPAGIPVLFLLGVFVLDFPNSGQCGYLAHPCSGLVVSCVWHVHLLG